MAAFALVAMLAGGPLGMCVALAYGVVHLVKVAKVDSRYAARGETPPSYRLVEKWLDGRKARGKAPAGAKPAKYGMWRYGWQRWQAMWEDLGEKHRETRGAYKTAVADAKANGKPLPPKPKQADYVKGWKWQIDQVTAPPGTSGTADNQQAGNVVNGKVAPNATSGVDSATATAQAGATDDGEYPPGSEEGLRNLVGQREPGWWWKCPLCPGVGETGVATKQEVTAKARQHDREVHPPGKNIASHDSTPQSDEPSTEEDTMPAVPVPAAKASGCQYPVGGGECEAETGWNYLYCELHLPAVRAEGLRRCMVPDLNNRHGVCGLYVRPGTDFCHHHQGSELRVKALPADDPQWRCPYPTADGPCGDTAQWDDRYCWKHRQANQPETEGDTMTQSTQQSGEVTGLTSAINYAAAVAAAHQAHSLGGGETYMASLAQAEVGPETIQSAAAAQEASAIAAGAWHTHGEKLNEQLSAKQATTSETAKKEFLLAE